MSEPIRDDIPAEKDYIEEVKAELELSKKHTRFGAGSERLRRLRRQIHIMQENKASDPEKYKGFNERRVAAYIRMRDLEHAFYELAGIVEDIEAELVTRWNEEDEEDIFDV